MLAHKPDSVAALATRALDNFKRIKEYNKLLEITFNQSPDTRELLLDCYTTLAEPYFEELELTLKALHKLIKANKGI